MISSIRMQINGFPGKSFARTFSTVPRKITSGTEFRISVFPATRFVDPRFRKTRTTLSSLSLPSSSPDFSRRISYKKKKKTLVDVLPLSPWMEHKSRIIDETELEIVRLFFCFCFVFSHHVSNFESTGFATCFLIVRFRFPLNAIAFELERRLVIFIPFFIIVSWSVQLIRVTQWNNSWNVVPVCSSTVVLLFLYWEAWMKINFSSQDTFVFCSRVGKKLRRARREHETSLSFPPPRVNYRLFLYLSPIYGRISVTHVVCE